MFRSALATQIENDQDIMNFRASRESWSDVVRYLQMKDSQELFDALKTVIRLDYFFGLALTSRCKMKTQDAAELFVFGMKQTNASSSRDGIEMFAPKLGTMRLVSCLQSMIETDPLIVAYCLYWMPVVLGSQPLTLELRSRISQLITSVPLSAERTIHDQQILAAIRQNCSRASEWISDRRESA
jgi:hypothetical protein